MGIFGTLGNLANQFSASTLTEYAPGFVERINNNPNGLLTRMTKFVFGLVWDRGELEFPKPDVSLTDEFRKKSGRKMNPLYAAHAYMDVFGNIDDMAPKNINVQYGQSPMKTPMTLMKYVDDHKTGFRGAIYQDSNGHSIVVYGGMDKAQHVDMKDIQALGQAKLFGRVNHQIAPAQKLYEDAIRMSSSVEVVGYSLGSMLANDVAARLDARATTLANIGLPETKNSRGESLYTREQRSFAEQNSIVLKTGHDPYFEKMGHVPGHVIELPDVTHEQVIKTLSDTKIPFNFNAQSQMCDHTPVKYKIASEKFKQAAQDVIDYVGPVKPFMHLIQRDDDLRLAA